MKIRSTPDLVTSSICFFATYLADGVFNILITFCLVLTLHPTTQLAFTRQVVMKRKVEVQSHCVF